MQEPTEIHPSCAGAARLIFQPGLRFLLRQLSQKRYATLGHTQKQAPLI